MHISFFLIFPFALFATFFLVGLFAHFSYLNTFFLSPLFAPAAFIPSSIFSKTLGTPTNLVTMIKLHVALFKDIVFGFHYFKRGPAWPEVLYVFKKGSLQCILVGKATRPTLQIKLGKRIPNCPIFSQTNSRAWCLTTFDMIKKTSIICPATWERGR